MSWLSEWWHWLFPNNTPPADPQNVRVDTLVANRVVVTGPGGEIDLISDASGAYILLQSGSDKPMLVIKRYPNGDRMRLVWLDKATTNRMMLDTTVNGIPSLSLTDNQGTVTLKASDLRKVFPPPPPAPPPSPTPTPTPAP